MTTSDARKRLAERNAATQADTSVEAVALCLECGHAIDRHAADAEILCFRPDHMRCSLTPTDIVRAHVAAALADALNGAGVTGGSR